MPKLKAPWANVSWTGYQSRNLVALLVAFFVALVLLGLAWLVFLGFVLYWNIGDVVRNGPSFWPVFWIVLASIGIIGALFGNRNSK